METSSFTTTSQEVFPDAELLPLGGSTCRCYRVKLYGKLHFLKRLTPELATDPRHVAALNKEFETGYRLEHPHLVRYISKTDDGILMDYVDGETLTEFTASHPDYFNSRKNADRLVRQLVDVVGYLHSHQIIHLDLKPDNILITRIGNNVKLIDLGYCYTDAWTDTMGHTDQYAAPEQLDGTNNVDARTDIYAIGRILQTLPCASYYDDIIDRCTRPNKDQRFHSAGDIIHQLDRHPVSRRWLWLLLLIPIIAAVYLFLNPPIPSDLQSPDAGAAKDSIYPQGIDTMPVVETQLPNQPDASIQPDARPQEPSALPGQSASQPAVVENKPAGEAESEPLSPQEVEELKATQANRKQRLGRNPSAQVLSQRHELQAIAEPIFNRLLAAYRDSAYNKINKTHFDRLSKEFRYTFMDKTYPVWQKCNAAQLMGSSDFQSECNETVKYYTQNLIYQMQRNAGNPSYRNKHYHYYDKN